MYLILLLGVAYVSQISCFPRTTPDSGHENYVQNDFKTWNDIIRENEGYYKSLYMSISYGLGDDEDVSSGEDQSGDGEIQGKALKQNIQDLQKLKDEHKKGYTVEEAGAGEMRLLQRAQFLYLATLGSASRYSFSMTTGSSAADHSVAFVTCPNEEVGKKIARGLVTKKLAACVNLISNITSIYEWEGKIEEESEVLLKIKTRTSVVPDLTTFVRENHPYDVAEVISVKIDQGNDSYLKWILETVPKPK